MYLFQFAMKNLRRHRRRTLITAAAIAIGIASFILIDSMLLGAEAESERNLIRYETASIRIHSSSWWQQRHALPLSDLLEEPEALLATLRKAGYRATARTSVAAQLLTTAQTFGIDGSLPLVITAIDASDSSVYQIIEGLDADQLPGEYELILGTWFAEDIKARVGSRLTLALRTDHQGEIEVPVTVSGLIDCPNPNVNRTLALMDRAFINSILDLGTGASSIDIALSSHRNLAKEQKRIAELLASYPEELTILSWEELAPDYLAIAASKQGGSALILFLVFIIAAVGISNTMLMAIYERTNEIGVLKALGISEAELYRSFLYEAAGIGALGSIVGLLTGALANLYLVEVGINLSFMLRDLDIGYRIQESMYGAWELRTFLAAALGGIILSIVAALLPVRRVTKLSIVDALRTGG